MLHIQTLYVVSGAQVNRMDKKMDNMQIIHSETCLFSHFTIPCPALSLEQYRCLHFKWIVIFFIYLFIYKSTMYILTKYIYFYLYIYMCVLTFCSSWNNILYVCVWGGHNEVSEFWQQQSMRACTPLFRKCSELVFYEGQENDERCAGVLTVWESEYP